MAFEPIYEVVALDYKTKLCSAQIVVEARLIPPPTVTISKVLGIASDVGIATSEVFSGEARVSGRVNFKVLYLSGDNATDSMDYNADFTDKISDDAITGGRPVVIGKILDTDIVSVSADEIKLAAVVEMELYDNRDFRSKYLVKGGEDIYTHEEKLDYTRLVVKADDRFNVEAEEELNFDRVLLVGSAVAVKDFDAGIDQITAEGEIFTRIVYEKEGSVFTTEIVTPFVQQTQADGARSGNIVDGTLKLLDTRYAAEEGKIKLIYELDLGAYVYAEESADIVSDAFSITHELNKTCEKLDYKLCRGCFCLTDTIDGSVTLEANMPIADSIVAAVGDNLNVTNVYAAAGRATVEGIVHTHLVYFSSEANTVSSVAVELPFAVTRPAPVKEGDELSAYGAVTGVTYKVRRGNELTLKADVSVCVSYAEPRSAELIVELNEGEEIEVPTSAISLHIARPKESLWEVAKALGTTPELVLIQNPEITLPLCGGERIIAYRHLKKM